MSPPTISTTTASARVRACNGCRQMKLRCDAHEDNYGACSRCRNMRRDCVISTSFKRRSRQTKAQLECELERLRAQYGSPPRNHSPSAMLIEQPNPPPNGRSSWESESNMNQYSESLPVNRLPNAISYPEDMLFRLDQPLSEPSVTPLSVSTAPAQDNLMTAEGPHEPDASTAFSPSVGTSTVEHTHSDRKETRTISQRLGDVELSARKINGCFSMFYQFYKPVLPGIFDGDKNPNDVYESSNFLFWTIVYVGARRYAKDPTIVESLTNPLKDFIHKSLFDPDKAISTIKASLLLCLWPLPISTTFRDQNPAIAGAAMQLAVQQGLHYSRHQDFVRVALKKPAANKIFRARLWAHCVTVFQSTNMHDGFPPPMALDPVCADRNLSISDGLPGIILYQYRLHRVLTSALASIMHTTDLDCTRDGDSLNSSILFYDAQAQEISPVEANDLGTFALNNVRLLIRGFHFFAAPGAERTAGILQLYVISCSMIQSASRMDKYHDFGNHCNALQTRAIALAAVCILRVHRSSLRTQIDIDAGEDMFFEAIRISKKHSIQNNDLDGRTSIILTQLWSSTRVFKFKDGSIDGLRLLLRGRLSMSVLFDCLWWWRAEFGGKSNPYVESETDRTHAASSSIEASVSTETIIHQNIAELFEVESIDQGTLPNPLLDPSELPNWNWGEVEDLDLNWY
ncbi:hypothetical protein P152DRAFT_454146 [Eremomyces bilateralis CBS 781.70]|uniref:Zn(2)-C6 fungal-type domain-containing protein n=1 Tax=Eremomyces bilateralis CBS 781.70 TaxID=1392243 RepID=A0A6G1GHJ0_9PEZI|nr:uncharacterized protein P152DRAFT_454146 [Eremomyces bilateralis CBS 781.70]KAF1817565.1 hypothetical protein P152DRAFT_454146 [Eremomyces bilateralis CBS 781.70]